MQRGNTKQKNISGSGFIDKKPKYLAEKGVIKGPTSQNRMYCFSRSFGVITQTSVEKQN